MFGTYTTLDNFLETHNLTEIKNLVKICKNICDEGAPKDISHNFKHHKQVVKNIKKQFPNYKINKLVLFAIAGAWLHDLVDSKYEHLFETNQDVIIGTLQSLGEHLIKICRQASYSNRHQTKHKLDSTEQQVLYIIEQADWIERMRLFRCLQYNNERNQIPAGVFDLQTVQKTVDFAGNPNNGLFVWQDLDSSWKTPLVRKIYQNLKTNYAKLQKLTNIDSVFVKLLLDYTEKTNGQPGRITFQNTKHFIKTLNPEQKQQCSLEINCFTTVINQLKIIQQLE